ncbi:MAG: head-tail connector protein [Dysgonamonadaceae bacterium]
MPSLVSLERVKSALRIDGSDDDELLSVYIEAASAAVINYLKSQAEKLLDLDSGGNLPSGSIVPPEIEMATLILVGHWYREPDGNPDGAFAGGSLPQPVVTLLYPLRDPEVR